MSEHPLDPNQAVPHSAPSPHPDSAEHPPRATVAPPSMPAIQAQPRDLGPLFTHRPLILGEDETLYDALLARVTHAVRPRDILEDMWVKDVVDEIWAAQRLRRLKAALLQTAAKSHLVRILTTATDPQTERPLTPAEAELLAVSCLQGDEQSLAEVAEMLMDAALDFDAITAKALSDGIEIIEKLDRLITSADARRDKALSNVDRRREAFARRLRQVAEDVESEPITTPVSDTEAA
ncbi:hypothetical protein ILT44_24365 [Microvirga sp. BT689]|uniref:hypothetical protein n=1 Tax=Microvirga arvi TaxID=2778731 RepID=UPI0019516864|nr:hypothetical protein [Microvirga arvi]MBM6583341.1 hypothetical protein [Microvirga arvi]